MRQGRDPAQTLEEIERDAFGGQDRTPAAANFKHRRSTDTVAPS